MTLLGLGSTFAHSAPARPSSKGFGCFRTHVARWLVLAATFLIPSLEHTAHAEVVSLAELESRALEMRGLAHGERARELASRAEVRVARSGYMPTAALNAGVSLAPGSKLLKLNCGAAGIDCGSQTGTYNVQGAQSPSDGTNVAEALRPYARYSATLSVQSRLYDFGRTSAAVDAAEAKLAAGSADAKALRAHVIGEVRGTYFAWMVRDATYKAAQRSVVDARTRRENVEGFIKDGVRPPADLVPVRRYEAAARLEEVKTRGDRDAAFDDLAASVGGPIPETAEPDPTILNRTQLGNTQLSNAEVNALRRKRDAALATARAHGRWRLPTLSAAAEAGVRGQTSTVFPLYTVGLSMTVPLWDGGSESAREEMARAEAMNLDQEARQAEYSLRAQTTSLKHAWQNANERVTVAEEVRALVETELRNAEDRYNLGQGAIEAVLDAHAALTRAESDVLLARLARAETALRAEPVR